MAAFARPEQWTGTRSARRNIVPTVSGPFDHLDQATQVRVAEILDLLSEASKVARTVEQATGFAATLTRGQMLDAVSHLISAVTDRSATTQRTAMQLESAEDHLRRGVTEQAEVAARYRIADVASKWDEYTSTVMPLRRESLTKGSIPHHAELEDLRQGIADLMATTDRRPQTWADSLGSAANALEAIKLTAQLDAALDRCLAAARKHSSARESKPRREEPRGESGQSEDDLSQLEEDTQVSREPSTGPLSAANEDPDPLREAPRLSASDARRAIAVSQLDFSGLDDAEFERLVFSLLVSSDRWINPAWVTETRAPDRGRDLEVERVVEDELLGTVRQRIFVQCRHRRKSVTAADCHAALAPIRLWEPPTVDLLIIATSSRFTTDAVQWIASHNADPSARTAFMMWPNSHLEMLLAGRQELISEFKLKPQST
jgi:hypothetical protein